MVRSGPQGRGRQKPGAVPLLQGHGHRLLAVQLGAGRDDLHVQGRSAVGAQRRQDARETPRLDAQHRARAPGYGRDLAVRPRKLPPDRHGVHRQKRTRDHNTFLVDGMGIGEDFTYWVYRGEGRERACNAKWDKVRLTKVHLEKTYGYALGDLSSAYPDELGRITLLRHVIMTRDVVVLLDEFDGEKPHVFTSVLHTDEIMQKQADGVWKLSLKDGGMMAYVLSPGETKVEAAEAIVFGGKGPGGGADVQRGYQLTIGTPKPVAAGTYVTVLTPLGSDQAVPRAVRCEALDKKAMTLLIDWGARTETIRLDMRWKPGEAAGPVTIR